MQINANGKISPVVDKFNAKYDLENDICHFCGHIPYEFK